MQEDIKVVIGAGGYNNNPGWIHTEETELHLLNERNWRQNFEPASISSLLAEHVWEHLTYEDGKKAASLAYHYLKPGGYVRVAVPDGLFPDEHYQKVVQVGGPGPEDHPAFDHKIVYTHGLLRALFEEVGFKVKLLEYYDDKGVFHCSEWSGDDGVIFRSSKYDPRNQGEVPLFPSLIVDAIKPCKEE
ncbi:class I SAM-dependent methyltransferase [Alkalicoccobacillus murimartini]|uniref:SAM-dependent methyltransferase n=1 Tax=Alkalicoccobacillus murimartini TaxID=171685 RepID=A0ABT9YIF5_9BACI|nr:SAM-dependent methyltransferase [Alkalicoccobacillus murimartini]MDQ0207636.1 putative SAM-dependent methyltransferase [Alkalicoccobacillus murimartini]